MQKHHGVIIFLLLYLCVPLIWAASSLDGDWVGGFDRPKGQVYVHVHFGTATNGTIDVIDPLFKGKLPQFDLQVGYVANTWIIGRPLHKVEAPPLPQLRFELADKDNPMSFNGWVTNGVMTGTVEDRGMKLPFRLDLTAKIDASRYAGSYQVGPGHFITLSPDAPGLLAFDTMSGEIKFLMPRSETEFVWGSGVKIYKAQATIHFSTNQTGEVTALQWKKEKAENTPVMAGPRVKLQEEEITFTNGNAILSGTLVLPPTKGPHPAVVICGGSESWVRNVLRFEAKFFALNGVAALIYDKRGGGRSTGDLSAFTYDDLAGDMLAGLERLKNRPDIKPRQIGLRGASQGGYIVPLAASRCADVAFIICVSGPGITPEADTAYCVEHWMKAEGYPQAEVDEARSLYLLKARYHRTGSGGNELEAAQKAAQDKPWYKANPALDAPPASTQARQTWIYDPVPTLQKVHCPVLAVYGEQDQLVPAQASADIWEAALREAGNHDVVIKIFPNAVHGIGDTRTGLFVPSFWTLQREWVLKHVAVNP